MGPAPAPRLAPGRGASEGLRRLLFAVLVEAEPFAETVARRHPDIEPSLGDRPGKLGADAGRRTGHKGPYFL